MVRLYALHILLVSEGLCPSCAARTTTSREHLAWKVQDAIARVERCRPPQRDAALLCAALGLDVEVIEDLDDEQDRITAGAPPSR